MTSSEVPLPLIRFPGKIILITSEENERRALRELAEEEMVGFDTETRPSFKRGEFYNVALIQLSTWDKAYLFRINRYGLTDEMIQFLQDHRIRKVGVGTRDDLTALRKIQPFEPEAFIDLGTKATEMGIPKTGIRNLTNLLLESRISKSQQTSNWERRELTQGQLLYAATDAWICLKLHQQLSNYPGRA